MKKYRLKRIDRGVKVRSETLYAIDSIKELAYLSFPRVLLIFGLLIMPLIMPNLYWQRVICLFGVYAILSIIIDFLISFVGLPFLGLSFFTGIGGYLSAYFNSYLNFPIIISIPLASFIGAILCTLALLPALPLRGIYFAILSFAYPLLLIKIIAATGIFGGNEGITGLTILTNVWLNQYLILVILLGITFFMRRLVNEDFGIVLQGIRDNDISILACGINVTFFKAIAIFISALFGCFSGAYLAHLYGWAGVSLFSLDFSIFPIAAYIVGGGGLIVGSLVGSIILVPASELLRSVRGLRTIFYCIIILLFIIFINEGISN